LGFLLCIRQIQSLFKRKMPTYAVYGGWVISIIAGWFEVTADNEEDAVSLLKSNDQTLLISFGIALGPASHGRLSIAVRSSYSAQNAIIAVRREARVAKRNRYANIHGNGMPILSSRNRQQPAPRQPSN
jgi:hypothetical protein